MARLVSTMTESAKQRRGFAAMSPELRREISSKGGKAAHAKGTGHEWDSASARKAGTKGGGAPRNVLSEKCEDARHGYCRRKTCVCTCHGIGSGAGEIMPMKVAR